MWKMGPTQIQAILYIHRNTQSMYPKVRLVKEIKGGGKEGKKDSE
jgi:hypothetical protein